MATKKKPPAKKKKKTPPKKSPVAPQVIVEKNKGGRPVGSKSKGQKPPAFLAKDFTEAAVDAIPVPDVELPNHDSASRQFLRYSAMLHYTTDLNGTTVERMATEHPMFRDVPVRTMKVWCSQDKWLDRRAEVLERWRVNVEQRIGDELMRKQMEAVKKVSLIRDKLLDRLSGKDHPYQETHDDFGNEVCQVCGDTKLAHEDPITLMSPDKLVNSLVKLYEMEIALHETILRYTTAAGDVSGAAARASGVPKKPTLTRPEARQAVKAILNSRKEALRESHGVGAATESHDGA